MEIVPNVIGIEPVTVVFMALWPRWNNVKRIFIITHSTRDDIDVMTHHRRRWQTETERSIWKENITSSDRKIVRIRIFALQSKSLYSLSSFSLSNRHRRARARCGRALLRCGIQITRRTAGSHTHIRNCYGTPVPTGYLISIWILCLRWNRQWHRHNASDDSADKEFYMLARQFWPVGNHVDHIRSVFRDGRINIAASACHQLQWHARSSTDFRAATAEHLSQPVPGRISRQTTYQDNSGRKITWRGPASRATLFGSAVGACPGAANYRWIIANTCGIFGAFKRDHPSEEQSIRRYPHWAGAVSTAPCMATVSQ